MRTKLLALFLLMSALCAADVIRLKNGKKIIGDNVREKGDKVEYNVGDATYAVSKSAVQAVDKMDGFNGHKTRCAENPPKPRPEPNHSVKQIPLKTEFLCKQLGYKFSSAGISPPMWQERCAQVLDGGGPNLKALEEIENECNNELSAAAYYLAGNFDHTALNEEGAAAHLKIAMEYNPDNPEILLLYTEVLMKLGRYGDSVPVAERLANRMGSEALVILGRAYYLAGMKDQAMQAWRLYVAARGGYGSVDGYASEAESFLRMREYQTMQQQSYGYSYYYRRPVIK